MPWFDVHGYVTISVHTRVRADNDELAKEKAGSRDTGECGPSHSEEHYEAWIADGLDGMPTITRVEYSCEDDEDDWDEDEEQIVMSNKQSVAAKITPLFIHDYLESQPKGTEWAINHFET